MTSPAPVPRHRRNPRRAYDEHGREFIPPTVGSCRAAGETTAAIYCEAVGCHHSATISTDPFPDVLPFPDIALRLRCSKCGSKQVRVMKDMSAHYERLEATGWGCKPFGPGAIREKGAPAEAEAPEVVTKDVG